MKLTNVKAMVAKAMTVGMLAGAFILARSGKGSGAGIWRRRAGRLSPLATAATTTSVSASNESAAMPSSASRHGSVTRPGSVITATVMATATNRR